MKSFVLPFALALTALSPLAAQASVTTWNVTDAALTINADPLDYYTDNNAVYGEQGRKVVVSGLHGVLDSDAGPATLKLTSEEDAGYTLNRYSLTAYYRFDYEVRDYDTHELLDTEHAVMQVGSNSQYSFYPPTGSFDATTGGVTVGNSSRLFNSFNQLNQFDFEEVYSSFNATGGYPGAFGLSYTSGSLYFNLNNGFTHRDFDPFEMDHLPYLYGFSGNLALAPAVPEPETYALFGVGLLGVAFAKRLRSKRAV